MVVVTGGYPSLARPTHMPFVRQFVHAVARQGVRCTVIHPVAIHEGLNAGKQPCSTWEAVPLGEPVQVLRPRFLSFAVRDQWARLGPLNPGLLTLNNFTGAVRRVVTRQKLRPDAFYGHFLYLAGAAAAKIGRESGVPSFPGVGEGEFWTVRKFGLRRAKRDMDFAAGFVANSSVLKSMLNQELSIPFQDIGVFPNGTDRTLFYPRDKAAMRHKYGLPQGRFLVACVGNYLWKKGSVRVAQAIQGLDGVGGVFMGHGPCPPVGRNVVFNQRVSHDTVPELLSAADVFVLPTVVEGSSNAIVEAMACGLPVVSSHGAFNDDLLTEEMSIRVDPLAVDAIRDAIVRLRDDAGLRRSMAEAALRRSARFDIDERARRILDFMEERL